MGNALMYMDVEGFDSSVPIVILCILILSCKKLQYKTVYFVAGAGVRKPGALFAALDGAKPRSFWIFCQEKIRNTVIHLWQDIAKNNIVLSL